MRVQRVMDAAAARPRFKFFVSPGTIRRAAGFLHTGHAEGRMAPPPSGRQVQAPDYGSGAR